MANTELWNRVVNVSGYGFGAAALVAPRALRRSYGAPVDPDAETMLRMWGVRLVQTAPVGTWLEGDDTSRRRGLQASAAANAAEAVALLAAGSRGAVPMRVAVQIAVTDLVFAGVAVAALAE